MGRDPAAGWGDGRGALDEEAEGHFLMDYALGVPGVYVMRVRARGETTRGSAFERERTLIAVAVPAGSTWRKRY
jgi:hypothetical protein